MRGSGHCGGALNRAGAAPWRAGQANRGGHGADRGRPGLGVGPESGSGTSGRKGMTGGPYLSAAATRKGRGAGRRGVGGLSWAAAGPKEGGEADEAGSPRAFSGLWPTGRASWAGL